LGDFHWRVDMSSIRVFLETGKKKVFAGGIDWPGWTRSGKDEETALQALVHYGPRYTEIMHNGGVEFQPPADISDLLVDERHEGNATTDFGAPAAMLSSDKQRIDDQDFKRFKSMLGACWEAFDNAVESATGNELRKGPRGGGRDLGKIIDHVLEADRGYLARLAWKHKREEGMTPAEMLARTRGAILDALEASVRGELPEKGPRGGKIWLPRFFVRRVAWHVLDHAWEIEDRIL
jgi:hypothetical protein